MDKTTPPKNEVELFGQRFHAVVGLFYCALGLVIATTLARWFPDGAAWRTPGALAIFAAATVWWIVLWRRGKAPPAPGASEPAQATE